MTTTIKCAADLPASGMITVKPWDSARSRGWCVERVNCDSGDFATVMATPVNIGTGRINGYSQVVHLHFDRDEIAVMPGAGR